MIAVYGKAVVVVTVVVDLDKAQNMGHTDMAARFLARFQHQGEDWQREAQGDPLVAEFLHVHVHSGEIE